MRNAAAFGHASRGLPGIRISYLWSLYDPLGASIGRFVQSNLQAFGAWCKTGHSMRNPCSGHFREC
jgi:hypothetical protein